MTTKNQSGPWGAVAGVAVVVSIFLGLALFAVAVYALTGEPLPDAAALVRRGALGVWSLLVPWGLLIPATLLLLHYAPRIAGTLDADKRALRAALDNAAALLVTERMAREDAERELRSARGTVTLLLAEAKTAGAPEELHHDPRGAATWLRHEVVVGRGAVTLAETRGRRLEAMQARLSELGNLDERATALAAELETLRAWRDAAEPELATLRALRAEYDAPVQSSGAGVQGFIAAASASPRRGIAPLAKLYRAHVGSLNTNDPAVRSLFSAMISLLPSPEDAPLVEAFSEGEGAAGAGEGAERADGLNAERSALNAEREADHAR